MSEFTPDDDKLLHTGLDEFLVITLDIISDIWDAAKDYGFVFLWFLFSVIFFSIGYSLFGLHFWGWNMLVSIILGALAMSGAAALLDY